MILLGNKQNSLILLGLFSFSRMEIPVYNLGECTPWALTPHYMTWAKFTEIWCMTVISKLSLIFSYFLSSDISGVQPRLPLTSINALRLLTL